MAKDEVKKVIRVVGEAAGEKIQVYADPYQSKVCDEQIASAKKNIVKKFAPFGIRENEIEWTESIETV